MSVAEAQKVIFGLFGRQPVTIDKDLIDRGRKLKEMRDGSEAFKWFKDTMLEKASEAHASMATPPSPLSISIPLSYLQGKVVGLREALDSLDDEIELGEKEAIKFLESQR